MNYHDIVTNDMANGEGLRVTLFVSGCEHHCPGCQNPVTWDPNDGLLFDQKAKDEIEEYLKQPYAAGITFSGGDPFAPYNRKEVCDYIIHLKARFPQKTVWVYTGYVYEDLQKEPFFQEIFPLIDVLVEGPFIEEKKDIAYQWAGSTNQRVIRHF